MDENLESQQEEEEALLAIYDGDPAFKQISSTVFQYKCGEDGGKNSVLVEFSWPPSYPSEKPIINLNTFYNQHLTQPVKDFIATKIDEKAEQYLGDAVIYTLIELVKDNLDTWMVEVSKNLPVKVEPPKEEITLVEEVDTMTIQEAPTKVTVKKEHLSKAQKRRQWDRCNAGGEQPRGWNWVDIVKHLSQTGSKDDCLTSHS
ncbi:RWD domain-containing protein 4 [Planococcus citri]|uniref:RWD domain-containing protein 4 n=1 Tax=Planococcus citri TaxID=170843 RepID=UPI0031F8BFAC